MTGLGWWSGHTLRGKSNTFLSVITAYRVCTGSIGTSAIGSAFSREYEHLRRSQHLVSPRPRMHKLLTISTFRDFKWSAIFTISIVQTPRHQLTLEQQHDESITCLDAHNFYMRPLARDPSHTWRVHNQITEAYLWTSTRVISWHKH